MAGWEESEIRLSSGQLKLELGLGLSLAIFVLVSNEYESFRLISKGIILFLLNYLYLFVT